ncbi:uncharacterized protein LOC120640442 isoform X10 [Panicum virgatum]|uniref:uncharacterized protein LOC120640442 isoform X10 n=1 Tax=Panicum virgatum TaxID=38727 RepID=UPI0019D6A5A4|nr:uncharacterized protein LOC120640442 isoform X10 [Panicum virgatum]
MGRVSFTASAPVLFAPLLSSGSNLLCSRPSALQACSVSPGVACFPFLLLSSGVCWVPDPFCCYHFLQFLADSYLCASCYVCGICSLCRCPLPSSAPHACTVPPPLTGSLDSPKRLSLGGLPLRHILGDCLLLQFVRQRQHGGYEGRPTPFS